MAKDIFYGDVGIYGTSKVFDNAQVRDNALIGEDAVVCGNALVNGYAVICKNSVVKSNGDFITFQKYWSDNSYITWTRSNDNWNDGEFHADKTTLLEEEHFYGTSEELVKKAYKHSEKNGRQYEHLVKYVEETLKEEDNGE